MQRCWLAGGCKVIPTTMHGSAAASQLSYGSSSFLQLVVVFGPEGAEQVACCWRSAVAVLLLPLHTAEMPHCLP